MRTSTTITIHQINNLVNSAVELAETLGFGQIESSQIKQETTHNTSSPTTLHNHNDSLNLPPYLLGEHPWQ